MKFAFNSIQYIMRDIPNGWFIRYVHANGASMFFIVVYAHLFRGLYYGSYLQPRELIWCSGVIILLLMMGTAFTGYVLPWGQMSFWGATVITSMGKFVIQIRAGNSCKCRKAYWPEPRWSEVEQASRGAMAE